MKTTINILASAVACVTLFSGCNSVNSYFAPKTEHIEYYRIYDVKTTAELDDIAEALKTGLSYNSVPTTNQSIPSAQVPEKPGRFEVVEPFAGTNFQTIASAYQGGATFKVAKCKGAIWTATADRPSDYAPVKVYACLWPYKEGYHVDIYANLTKTTGGLYDVSRIGAEALVGTAEEWTEKTLLDPIRELSKLPNTEVQYLEGYPKQKGTPWLDDYAF